MPATPAQIGTQQHNASRGGDSSNDVSVAVGTAAAAMASTTTLWGESHSNTATRGTIPDATPITGGQPRVYTTNHNRQKRHTSSSTKTVDAVDSYAQRILAKVARESLSTSTSSRHVFGDDHKNDHSPTKFISIDESLGPYVTSCMRNASREHSHLTWTDFVELADYDCLVELIQEHCQVDDLVVIAQALQHIANAVFHSVFESVGDENEGTDQSGVVSRSAATSTSAAPGYHLKGDDETLGLSTLTLSSTTTPPRNGATSQWSHESDGGGEGFSHHRTTSLPNHLDSLATTQGFHQGSSSLSLSSLQSNSAVATAGSMLEPVQSQCATSQQYVHDVATKSTDIHNEHEQQQQQEEEYHHWYQLQVAQYLQSMNTDGLSDEAAWAATIMADGHVNVAQHLIDCATSQLPLCRNLLSHGCYRADCSFSHDRESHTCIFWLKSKCGKGSSNCKFLHGFAERHLETAPEPDSFYHDSDDDNDLHHTAAGTASGDADGYDHHAASGYNYMHKGGGQHAGATTQTSLWIPSPPPSNPASAPSSNSSSFANIASRGYDTSQSFPNTDASSTKAHSSKTTTIPTIRIPQDLWNPHEQRDSSAFYITDPLERYQAVMATNSSSRNRNDVIDLHFQSLQTFAVVLESVLPTKLEQCHGGVWIITGTGHHVGTQTHQKGGGALEAAVVDYLVATYVNAQDGDFAYTVSQGRDRNGKGGAILVQATKRRSAARRPW